MAYSSGTNWNNERLYLNNLIAAGGGNGEWAKQQLQQLESDYNLYSQSSAKAPVLDVGGLGNLQNALDQITGLSDKASARSLEYAQQNQAWSAEQAEIARGFNAAEAAKNRDWQEYMSNTAHQREVADLRRAGLNPVLSAMGGNGAAVTSGSTASGSVPSGASGQSDMSATTALVSVLGTMLSAQTSLSNAALSARTNETIADKANAVSELVARLGAAASMSNASTAAAASRYSSDMSYKLRQDFPDSMLQILNSVLSDNGTSYDSLVKGLLDKFGVSIRGFNGGFSGKSVN